METSIIEIMQKLFEKSDFSFFDHDFDEINKNFSQSILEKFPSDFFNEWLKKINITKKFTTSLIKNIYDEKKFLKKELLTHLLYYLIENKYYNKNNVVHLENLLLSYEMYNHIVFLRMYVKDKTHQLITANNLNFLKNLTKVGIVDEKINDKILKLSLNEYDSLIDIYDVLIEKMLILTYDEQIKLISRVNPTVFQMLVDSNSINLNEKKLQKILSFASHYQNIDLYLYLLVNDKTIPSKTDILGIFGLTLANKSKLKQLKISRHRRYISPTTRFRHKFNFNCSEYSSSYVNKLTELVKYYSDNNIKLENISGIKHYICYLLSNDHLELQLELCKNIGYKHGGHTLLLLIHKLIKKDDPLLLKKFIEYSQISAEKFVNSSYLPYAINNNSFKVADFMTNVLKMKTTSDSLGMLNIEKIKFLHEHNLPIYENIMNKLFGNCDTESIDYCISTFNFKVTRKMLTFLLMSNSKNTLSVFKKYYNILKHVCQRKLLLYVLNNTTFTIFTLAIIKILTKNIKIKQNMMPIILKTNNFKIIKYFCEYHNLNFDNISCETFVSSLFKFKKYIRQNYRMKISRRNNRFSYTENSLNIIKYVKTNFNSQFEIYSKNQGSIIDLCIERGDKSLTLDFLSETFDWKMSLLQFEAFINIEYADESFLKIVEHSNHFPISEIERILEAKSETKYFYYIPYLYFLVHEKYNIDISKYVSPDELMEKVAFGDFSVKDCVQFLKYYPNIKLSPFIYSCFALYMSRYTCCGKYELNKLIKINEIYDEITQIDYENIIKMFKNIKCKFKIIDHKFSENELKLLDLAKNRMRYGYYAEAENDDNYDDIIDDLENAIYHHNYENVAIAE